MYDVLGSLAWFGLYAFLMSRAMTLGTGPPLRLKRVRRRSALAQNADPFLGDPALTAAAMSAFGTARLPAKVDYLREYSSIAAQAVQPIRVLNNGHHGEPRVVVHAEAKVRFSDGRLPKKGRAAAFWTMARRDGQWVVVATETEIEGKYHLEIDPVLDSGENDELADDHSLLHLVVDERSPARPPLASGQTEGGRATTLALRDAALIDPRFEPDVIEASVRVLLHTLEDLALGTPEAAERLGHLANDKAVDWLTTVRSPKWLRTIREPEVRELTPVVLDTRYAQIELTVTCRVRIEAPMSRDHNFCWDLALCEDPEVPWRLINADAGSIAMWNFARA